MNENWRSIPGFPSYEVSDLGRVRRAARGNGTQPGRLVALTDRRGYRCVHLSEAGKPRRVGVHRLVAAAFLGPVEGLDVNHLNGVTDDNRVSNLEICTNLENIRHAFTTGLRNEVGEANNRARLKAIDVLAIRRARAAGEQAESLALRYGVSRDAIYDAARGKTWKHLSGELAEESVA